MGINGLKVYESRYAEMPQVIVNCSLGLAICKTDIGDSLKGVMPTKVAEFLAVGRPVLISEGMGDLDSMILENSVGWRVDRDTNLDELTESIQGLMSDEELPKRCRAVAEKYFNMEMASSNYINLYQKSLGLNSF
jgi:glycosyltransferase involved in cell wall biosynthesis